MGRGGTTEWAALWDILSRSARAQFVLTSPEVVKAGGILVVPLRQSYNDIVGIIKDFYRRYKLC
jgi:hypothetical protein